MPVELAKLSTDVGTAKENSSTRLLRVECDAALPATALEVGKPLADSGLLRSVHEHVVERVLYTNREMSSRLTIDNPFLTRSQCEPLESSGLIREGTVVQPGDVLASVVGSKRLLDKQPPPPEGMEWAINNSEFVPLGWGGSRVVHVEYEPASPAKSEQRPVGNLRIVLRIERPLAPGDVLVADSNVLGVVSDLTSDPRLSADLRVGETVGRKLGLNPGASGLFQMGKSEALGVLSVQVRSTGLYSLISLQPLKGRHPHISQTVDLPHVRWLRSFGLDAILTELVVLKSDDWGNRSSLKKALGGEGSFPAPGAPESLWFIEVYLMALGVAVQVEPEGDHVRLRLTPLADDHVLALSSGEINEPETIDFRTYGWVPGGLFCETIFGTGIERRQRFGHFVLSAPVVPYLWRIGKPSLLEHLLQLGHDEIESILSCESFVRRSAQAVTLVRWEQAPKGAIVLPSLAPEEEDLGTGAAAIESLLRLVPDSRVPLAFRGRLHTLVQRNLPVMPPDVRPFVSLENGNFATSDLNDLYRRVLHRSKRLQKLIDVKAPEAVPLNERKELQHAVDQLMANCQFSTTAFLGPRGLPLKDVLSLLAGLTEPARRAKRVDFSGQAHAVVDPSIPADTVLLPQSLFTTLGLSTSTPVLLTVPAAHSIDGAAPFVALMPVPDERNTIRLRQSAYSQLGFASMANDDGLPICIVHRPLGPDAIAEAMQLIARVPRPKRDQPDAAPAKGWFDFADVVQAAANLAAAVANGVPTSLDSDCGVLLGGPGLSTFSWSKGTAYSWPNEYKLIPRATVD